MHKFYYTNNLGGGGTNVSRCTDYMQLFALDNIGLLLNYYYLNPRFNVKMRFDNNLIRRVSDFDSIEKFLNAGKIYFSRIRKVSGKFSQDLSATSLNGYLLDNGCGNIIRDLIKKNEYNRQSIQELVGPFHGFAESLNLDIAIALDYAMKYTYKDRENKEKQLMDMWRCLTADENINLELIDSTLKLMSTNKFTHKIYAPLHGFNYDSYENYLQRILERENSLGTRFDGFALGGIADMRRLPDSVWEVPANIKKEMKTGYIISRLCKRIFSLTDRPLHILGAGNIYALPFIIHAGATSSDCHSSAWRRASDGGYSRAKILIPLLNDRLEFINNKDALTFVKIKDIDDSYNFEFGYSIDEIKKLYLSLQTDKEDYYFGEILAFYSAIKQYDLIIRYARTYPDFLQRLCNTPDKILNNNYRLLCDTLKL